MSSHEQLSAASNDRKTRLAQLKSLKRKQAPSDNDNDNDNDNDAAERTLTNENENENESSKALTNNPSQSLTSTSTFTSTPSVTTTYLSGRNFDPTTRNVKLGYTSSSLSPNTSTTRTLEQQAATLALASRKTAEAIQDSSTTAAHLDLFTIQPKRANWDLKRDLEERMRVGGLVGGLERAVGGLVRERVGKSVGGEEGELVGGVRVREMEDEEGVV